MATDDPEEGRPATTPSAARPSSSSSAPWAVRSVGHGRRWPDARPQPALRPAPVAPAALRRPAQLGRRARPGPQDRRRDPGPEPDGRPADPGRRRRPAGRPLARRDHRLPLRGDHRGRLEPRRVGRQHHRGLEGAGRAGRPAVRRCDGLGAPRGGAGPGRADPRHPRQGDRRAAGQPGRLRARHAGRRGAHGLRHRRAADHRGHAPRWCRPTWRRSPTGST